MKTSSAKRPLAWVLLVIAVGYMLVDWKILGHMGGYRLFSPTRISDGQDFKQLIDQENSFLANECSAGRARFVFFDDHDVTFPYVINSVGSCTMMHETGVTPFTPAQFEGCDRIVVTTFANPSYGKTWRDTTSAPKSSGPWTKFATWDSPSKRFRYVIYAHPCYGAAERRSQ